MATSTPSRDGATPPSVMRGKRRRDAGKACTYCRKRKMRCTGGNRCKNCEMYDQECVYADSRQRPRPTNATIEHLRQENQRLRERTTQLGEHINSPETEQQVQSDTVGLQARNQASESPSIHTPISVPAVERLASPDATATYHGPTSTLYNSSAAEATRSLELRPEREMSNTLFAAAAQQRQMELVNARQGKLDYDGNDPEIVVDLLNLHWNRQHHAFLVTYRPAFMRDMACDGPYYSKLLLNAIMYGASKFHKDGDVRTAGWKFRNRVRDLLGQALDHSSITTIQALLQMSNSLWATNEQSAAWIYAGTAFRMMVDLGLHIDIDRIPDKAKFSEEDIEIRRRVYWSAFVVDRIQCLYQGRPVSVVASDVPARFLDEYEEMEHWQPYAYTSDGYPGHPSYSISTFTNLCQLCIILTDVLNSIYQDRAREKKTSVDLVQQLDCLEERIQEWKSKLPEHLQVDLSSSSLDQIPPPHVLSLHLMHGVLKILLHRPFVADGHLHTASPAVARRSLAACAEAATTIVKVVRAYEATFGTARAPYLVCYATYVAATIHVRVASTRDQTSSEAHESLKACLSVIEENAKTNAAATKASKVIRGLVQSMSVVIEEVPLSRARGDTHLSLGQATTSPRARSKEDGLLHDANFDAIIQSFWNVEQPRAPYGDVMPAIGVENGRNNQQGSYQALWNPINPDPWSNVAMPDDLFGFNNSDLEFIYGQAMGGV